MENNRVYWIDIAKSAAILGVVLQHARGWAYSTDVIYRSLIFAVGLFVMLGGYNITGSYIRNDKVNVLKRLLGIIIPYVFATLIYCAYSGEITDTEAVIIHLIHFDAMAPLYYVAVYSQLLIVTPLLLLLLKWCDKGVISLKLLRYCGAWILILSVCRLTTAYTKVPGIIIGGGNLFAGPWLMFWFAGMCTAMYLPPRGKADFTIREKRIATAIFAVTSVLLILWHYVIAYKAMGDGMQALFHSDQVPLTWAHAAEVALIFAWFYASSSLFEGKWMSLFGFLGRHSLYIFLFHILFLEIYISHFFNRLNNKAGRINTIAFLVFIIVCPIAIEAVVKRIKDIIFLIPKKKVNHRLP